MKRALSWLAWLMVGVMGLVAVSAASAPAAHKSRRNKKGQEGESGEHDPPSDWFVRQRAFPFRALNQKARLAAFAAAKRYLSVTPREGSAWTFAGPDNIGGRITDLEAHPMRPGMVFVGAASGGVFRSDDGGAHFRPVFDQEASLSIGDLALDPKNPDVVWVGTGEANLGGGYPGTGIYLSRDGGATWQLMGLPDSQHIGRVVVVPNDSSTVYEAAEGNLYQEDANRGLYRTHDAGQTWERVLAGANNRTGAIDVVLDPAHAGTVYAALWERISTAEGKALGGTGSGLFKSVDAGASWQPLAGGLPAPSASNGRIGITLCASQPQVLYAVYHDTQQGLGGVFRTADGGAHWSRVQDRDLSDIYGGNDASNYGWWFGNIRVSPVDASSVYVLGLIPAISHDGGQSWTFVDAVHPDQHALYIDPTNDRRLFLGNDGGFYASADRGQTWSQPARLPITQFYDIAFDPAHPERLFGGAQDNGVVRTPTGGTSDWADIYGGDGFFVVIDPSDPRIMYTESQFGALGKSTDGGNTFNSLDPGAKRQNWNTPILLDPNNPKTIYYGAEALYRSTDGGDNWTAVSNDLTDPPPAGGQAKGTISTISVARADSRVIYVGTDDGNAWVSRDGGGSWTKITTGLPKRYVTRVHADPASAARVFLTVSGYALAGDQTHVYRSDNYGMTWTSIGGGLPPVPVQVILRDPRDMGTLYLGTDAGAYVSHDVGATWQPLGSGLPLVPIQDLALDAQSGRLVAGSYGRSMFTLTVGGTSPRGR